MRRQLELVEAVIQIIETGKQKNGKGALLYPVLQEPVVAAFFNSPKTLAGVLREKPELVINLIQNNKELETFWHRAGGDDLWIPLIDALVEREMGTYASEIYPVIVVAKYRRSIIWPDIFGVTLGGNAMHAFNLVTVVEPRPFPISSAYYVAYHDPLTRAYLEVLRRVVNVRQLEYFNVSGILRRFLNYPRYYPTLHLVAFDDFFLCDETTYRSYSFEYNIQVMRETVEAISARVTSVFIVGETVAGKGVYIRREDDNNNNIHTKELAEELLALQRIVRKLTLALENPARLLDKVVPIKLDKYVATPYRTLLYDAKQGIYATPEAQRQYFIDTLVDLAHKIELNKYSLKCTVCHTGTCMVDTRCMRPFCTEACLAHYLKIVSC